MNAFIETVNAWGGNFRHFAGPMLWQSSLLIVLLFAIDFAFRRRIRAAVRHALWLVVLVKLLLPPALALPTSLAWWTRPAPAVVRPPERTVIITYGDAVPQPMLAAPGIPVFTPAPPPPTPKISSAGRLLVSGAAIAFGLLAWILRRWAAVAKTVRDATAPDAALLELLADAKLTLNLRRNVTLRLTDQPMSPAVCGLVRATILLPRQLAGLPANQLRAVLLHELIHLKRGDVWVNCAQALFQVVYWWHPLLWLANARIRRVREEAVDDAVMLTLRDDAEAYAPTLLEVAKLALNRPLTSLGLVGILESRSALRQRIERLVNYSSPRRAGLSALSLLGVATFAAIAVPMGERPEMPDPTLSSRSVPESESPRAIIRINGGDAIQDTGHGTTTVSNGVRVEFASGQSFTADSIHFDEILERLVAHGVRSVTAESNDVILWSANEMVWDTKNNAVLFTNHISAIVTKGPSLNKARLTILSKLDRIRLEEVFYSNLNLEDVLNNLTAEIRNADPNHRGISMLLNPHWPSDRGTAGSSMPSSNFPIGTVLIKMNQSLTNVRVADALDAIVKSASHPIKYSVEDYSVIISARGPEAPLYLRTFAIDTNAFYAALEDATGMKFGSLVTTEPNAANGRITTTNNSRISVGVQIYFNSLGVDLTSPAATVAGKAALWNDGAGQLLVRAEANDLKRIEAGLQKFAPASDRTIPESPAANLQSASQLYTRTFTVDRKTFHADFFKNLGVNLDYQAGKSVFYGDRKGMLLIRATAEELEIIEMGLKKLTDSSPSPEQNLLDKSYALDPNTVYASLTRITGTNTTAANAGAVLEKYLAALNLDLRPPKNISWDARTGYVRARATQAELDALTRAVTALNIAPPQINIRARFVEVTAEAQEALGLNLYLGQFEMRLQTNANPAGVFPGAISGTSAFTNETTLSPTALGKGFAGILIDPQFRGVLTALDQRKGVTLLARPEITTVSGRSAQVQIGDQHFIANGIKTEALTPPGINASASETNGIYETQLHVFGPVLDVIPTLAPDGYTVTLSVTAALTEFLGYDAPTNFVIVYKDGRSEKVGWPQPRIRNRQSSVTANVWDGQTVVLGGMMADGTKPSSNQRKSRGPDLGGLPSVGKGDGREMVKKNLIVFVTVTLLDPAGNRLHTDEELAFTREAVPPRAADAPATGQPQR